MASFFGLQLYVMLRFLGSNNCNKINHDFFTQHQSHYYINFSLWLGLKVTLTHYMHWSSFAVPSQCKFLLAQLFNVVHRYQKSTSINYLYEVEFQNVTVHRWWKIWFDWRHDHCGLVSLLLKLMSSLRKVVFQSNGLTMFHYIIVTILMWRLCATGLACEAEFLS